MSNELTFMVKAHRAEFIKKEVGANHPRYTFETRVEEGEEWTYITIRDIGCYDALQLFHAGFEAGYANAKEAFYPKNIFPETVA